MNRSVAIIAIYTFFFCILAEDLAEVVCCKHLDIKQGATGVVMVYKHICTIYAIFVHSYQNTQWRRRSSWREKLDLKTKSNRKSFRKKELYMSSF